MKMTKKAHWMIGLQNFIFYTVFLAVIGVLGYLAQKYTFKSDWTFGSRNTLTQETQTLLSRLDKPLSFTAYVPDEPALKAQLEKLIAKYEQFKPDTTIEFVNPDLNPGRAKAAGIQYAGQVVVSLGERSEVIESVAEQKVANVLQRLARDKPRMVVFLEGHEERNPFSQESSGMSTLANSLTAKGFNFQPHNLLRTQSVPDNASFLVIASPQKDIPEGEVAVIKQYLEQGGNLLWLHEPGTAKGLEEIAELLNVIVHEGTLVDANEELRKMLGIQHPAVIPVVDYGGATIAKDMQTQTLFPFATAITQDAESESDWTYQAFLSSLPSSWLESGDIEGNIKYESDDGDLEGPLTLGLAMSRTLPGEGENDINQRVVVVGDSDFMLNAFVGHAGNMDLSIGIFNWLAKDDNLLSIKITGAPDTELKMSQTVLYSFSLFFLLVLPVLLLVVGYGMWMRRRRR